MADSSNGGSKNRIIVAGQRVVMDRAILHAIVERDRSQRLLVEELRGRLRARSSLLMEALLELAGSKDANDHQHFVRLWLHAHRLPERDW